MVDVVAKERKIRYPSVKLENQKAIILNELGMSPTSLVSPARAYEKSQIGLLYDEKKKTLADPVRTVVIDSIGLEIFGRSWEDYFKNRRSDSNGQDEE